MVAVQFPCVHVRMVTKCTRAHSRTHTHGGTDSETDSETDSDRETERERERERERSFKWFPCSGFQCVKVSAREGGGGGGGDPRPSQYAKVFGLRI